MVRTQSEPEQTTATTASALHETEVELPAVARLGAGAHSWLKLAGSGAVVFALIAAWHGDILYEPPYWDAAMGLFLEANFLAEHNFDYRRLWFEEPRFIEGGAAIYLTSVLPTLVALLMVWCPTPESVFLIYHLLTFACAAAVGILIWALARPFAGSPVAALAAAAVLTTPLLAVQIEMLGMDIPMLVAALASAAAFFQRRFVLAAVAGGVAFFLKMTGGLVLGVMVACLLSFIPLWYLRASARVKQRLWIVAGIALMAMSGVLATDTVVGQLSTSEVEQYTIDHERGLANLAELRIWCPDVVIVFGVTLVAWLLVRGRELALRVTGGQRPLEAVSAQLLAYPHEIYGWLLIGGMLLVLMLAYTIPRYLILPLPFLYVIAVGLLGGTEARRFWVAVALAVVVGCNLANRDGRFYPAFPEAAAIDDRTGAIVERSREYLPDHRAHQRAVAFLATHCGDRAIIAGNPLVHFLALPRLGYVERPLAGYSASTYHTEDFPTIDALCRETPPTDPVFVYVNNRFAQNALGRIPPPAPRDRVLWSDSHWRSPIEVYEKIWHPSSTPEEIRQRVVSLVWPASRLFERGEHFAEQDDLEAARQAYETVIEIDPNHLEARYELALLDAKAGRHQAAADQLETVLRIKDDVADVHALYAQVLIPLGERTLAEHHLWQAVDIDPENAPALRTLGRLLLDQGDLEQALEAARRAVRHDPDEAASHALLGLVQLELNNPLAARDAFARALELDSESAELCLHMANVLVSTGDVGAAVDYYRRALALRPGWSPAANNLAWILATWADANIRDGSAAVEVVQTALAASPATAGLLDTLAAALAEAGRFEEAVAAAQQALALAEEDGDTELANRISARLKLYQRGIAYRQGAER